METAGESPSMWSTSGLSICPRNCRAYADSDSTYRRCPSAKIVSNASDDLPDPERPVMTTILSRGISTVMFFRLWTRAPTTRMEFAVIGTFAAGDEERMSLRNALDQHPMWRALCDEYQV